MNGADVAIQLPPETKAATPPLVPTSRKADVMHAVIRLLCLLTSATAASVMTTATQASTISLYGFSLPLFSKWSFSDSFEYLVGVSGAVAVHSLLQLLIIISRILRKSAPIPSRNHAWLIFAGDQIFAYASCIRGDKPEPDRNSSFIAPEVLQTVHVFCDRVAVSIALAFFTRHLCASSCCLPLQPLDHYFLCNKLVGLNLEMSLLMIAARNLIILTSI